MYLLIKSHLFSSSAKSIFHLSSLCNMSPNNFPLDSTILLYSRMKYSRLAEIGGYVSQTITSIFDWRDNISKSIPRCLPHAPHLCRAGTTKSAAFIFSYGRPQECNPKYTTPYQLGLFLLISLTSFAIRPIQLLIKSSQIKSNQCFQIPLDLGISVNFCPGITFS